MERAREAQGSVASLLPSLGSWASDWQLLAQLILSWSSCSNADLITYLRRVDTRMTQGTPCKELSRCLAHKNTRNMFLLVSDTSLLLEYFPWQLFS